MVALPIVARPTGKRGRPSRDGERAITVSILDAALKLFLEFGYGATSMKRIGEVAGVAPNTLYARYPDKADLFRAIIEWKAALWKVTNPPRFAPPGSTLYDVLKVAIIAMLEAMDRDDISAIGLLLAMEAGRFPELALIYHEVVTTAGHYGLPESIQSCGDCDLSEQEAGDIARTVIECIVGHTKLQAFDGTNVEPHRKAAERIASIFTRRWGQPRDR